MREHKDELIIQFIHVTKHVNPFSTHADAATTSNKGKHAVCVVGANNHSKIKLLRSGRGSARRGRVKTSTLRDRTFRWRQIKTIDKSCNLDRVHLRCFKAMYLLEVGGLKRTKVAAAAMKSSLCFDIICLSRIPSASTRQQLRCCICMAIYADMLTDRHTKDVEKELVVSEEPFSPFMLHTWMAV